MNTKTTRITPEQVEGQMAFCQKIHAYWTEQNITPKAYVETYGCQQNEADSERIRGMLSEAGYAITNEAEGADVVVMNTCAIREHAEQRVFGNLGALTHTKRRHPRQKIFLCGCMAGEPSVCERIKKSFPHVSGVFSTHHLWEFPSLLWQVLTTKKRAFAVEDEAGSIAENIPVLRGNDLKAWVSVMYGCNNFCTYCIVPYVRGRERSRKMADILNEIKSLAANGVREITLLGQNVNSYGKDLTENDGCRSFADLLTAICESIKDTGLKRIRFMTSHPKDLSDELIDVMAKYPAVCKQLHLPVQAGSTALLNKMNRRYTKESYLALVERIRAKMPDIVLSTDIIVGFPEETPEDFEETLDLVTKVQYDMAYTFIYSPRVGTPAAKNPNQVPEEEVKEHFGKLVELQNSVDRKKNEAMVGKTVEVLCEGLSRTNIKRFTGRTEGNKIVNFTADIKNCSEAAGKFVKVYIDSAQTWSLDGHAVEWEE